MLLAKQGIDPRLVTMARGIKDAQGPEIEQMSVWLAAWGTSATPGNAMPLSDGGMAALENAQGTEASRLFLKQMIQHHGGALTMADEEVVGGEDPRAVTMARSILVTQQKEIDTMKALLATL